MYHLYLMAKNHISVCYQLPRYYLTYSH